MKKDRRLIKAFLIALVIAVIGVTPVSLLVFKDAKAETVEESQVEESAAEESQEEENSAEESSAEESSVEESSEKESQTNESKPLTGKWIKKDGKYYWKWSDGTVIKKSGWQKLNGKRYYLGKGGARVSGWKTIKKKRYYFKKDGVLYGKTGFKKIDKKKYFFTKKHYVLTGVKKVKDKKYCFSSKGVLRYNLRGVKVGNKYYNVDSKGVAKKISKNEANSEKAALKFIKSHGGSNNTKKEKLRKCFYYMTANMRYNPGYFTWSKDKVYFENKDGLYQLALEMFNAKDLRGNCHRFACCFAAVAKELGYKAYVVTTTGDHSFVMINGKYYDNSGARFGTDSRPAYNVYKKQKM